MSELTPEAPMEYALALTAAVMTVLRRNQRVEALKLMDEWLDEPNGAGRQEAHARFRAHLSRFLGA